MAIFRRVSLRHFLDDRYHGYLCILDDRYHGNKCKLVCLCGAQTVVVYYTCLVCNNKLHLWKTNVLHFLFVHAPRLMLYFLSFYFITWSVIFWPKVGHISSKWDKSGTFQIRFKYILVPRTKM